MDVADVLRRAADAVDRSGVAGDLRSVAFTTAVQLVLSAGGEQVVGATGAATPGTALPAVPETTPRDDHAPAAVRERHAPVGGPSPEGAPGGPDGAGDPAWDLDEGPDHRTSWPQAPRVLRPLSPLSSAPPQRVGPRLALRPDSSEAERGSERGSEWPASRRGGDRLVAVSPRTWASAPGAGEEPWGSIADALGVRPELLDRVWEERGGKIQLAGDPARLGRTRAQRVGTAAVLLLAALRWSGRDGGEPVPDSVVRAEVERLGLLDTGNYTKHLAGRRHLLSTTGSGRGATYKLRYDGLEEARVIARALLEEG